MQGRQFLQIPGPANVPDRVFRAMTQPLINHRGPEFARLMAECVSGLKEVYQTDNDILLFPSSGSGGLEAAVVNTLSPGDRVLAAVQGVFSERFVQIATKFGAIVDRVEFDWGKGVDPARMLDELQKDTTGSYKVVFMSHNETSTGVLNDVRTVGLGKAAQGHPALLMVDAVSSMALADLQTDAWNVDVVVTGSQKGLMLPPGMAIVSVSPRAWEAVTKATMPRWYWDWKQLKTAMDAGRVPVTPATSLMFGMKEALEMIHEEGLANVFARHRRLAKAVRDGLRGMGLTVLPAEVDASPSVTAVNQPSGVDQKTMNRLLREKYGVVIGGGLQKLEGKIFRIGHMGYISEPEVLAILGAIELVLAEMGTPVRLGEGLRAAELSFLESCRS